MGDNDDNDWGLERGVVIPFAKPSAQSKKTIELSQDAFEYLTRLIDIHHHILSVVECDEDKESIQLTEDILDAMESAK